MSWGKRSGELEIQSASAAEAWLWVYQVGSLSLYVDSYSSRTGLLPLLKSIQKQGELKKYKGQTLAIDGYGWLHRAAYSCALELGQDKPTTKYASLIYCRQTC